MARSARFGSTTFMTPMLGSMVPANERKAVCALLQCAVRHCVSEPLPPMQSCKCLARVLVCIRVAQPCYARVAQPCYAQKGKLEASALPLVSALKMVDLPTLGTPGHQNPHPATRPITPTSSEPTRFVCVENCRRSPACFVAATRYRARYASISAAGR